MGQVPGGLETPGSVQPPARPAGAGGTDCALQGLSGGDRVPRHVAFPRKVSPMNATLRKLKRVQIEAAAGSRQCAHRRREWPGGLYRPCAKSARAGVHEADRVGLR